MKILRKDRRRLKILELRALRHITIASFRAEKAEKLFCMDARDMNAVVDAFIVAHAARQDADRYVKKAVYEASSYGSSHAIPMATSINSWHLNSNFNRIQMPAQDSSIFSLADIAIEKLKAVAVIYKIAQTAGGDQTCVNNKFDLNARKKYLAAERRLFDVEVGSIGKNVMHYFLASRIEKLIPYVSSEDQYIFVSFYRKSINSILRRIKK